MAAMGQSLDILLICTVNNASTGGQSLAIKSILLICILVTMTATGQSLACLERTITGAGNNYSTGAEGTNQSSW